MATNSIKTFEGLANFNEDFYDSTAFYKHLQSVIFEIYTGDINGNDLVELTTDIATDIAHVFDNVTEVEINELKTHRKEEAKFLEDMLRLLASSDKPSIKYFMKTFANVLSKSNPELYRSYFGALLKNTGQDGGMFSLSNNPLKTAATILFTLRLSGIGRGDEPIRFFPSWQTFFQTKSTGPELHELIGTGEVVVFPTAEYVSSSAADALLVNATQLWSDTLEGSAIHTAETSVYYKSLSQVQPEYATSGVQALLAGSYGPLVKKQDTSVQGSINIGRLEKNVTNASRQVRTNRAAAASMWRWQTEDEKEKAKANEIKLNETQRILNETRAIVNSTAGLVDVKNYKGSTTVISQLAYGVAQAVVLSDAPLTPQIAASIVSAGPRILAKVDANITTFTQEVEEVREAYGKNQTALEASRREFNRIRDRLENLTDEILGTNETIQTILSNKVPSKITTRLNTYGEHTLADLTTNQTKLADLIVQRTELNQTLQTAAVYLAGNLSSFNRSETIFNRYNSVLQNMTELRSALVTRVENLRTNPPQARITSRTNNAKAAAAGDDENIEAVNIGANGNARQVQVLSPGIQNGMALSIPIDLAGETVIARLPEGKNLALTTQQLTQYLEHSLNMASAFSEVGKVAESGVSRKEALKSIKSLVYGKTFESSRQLAIAGKNNAAAVTNAEANPLLKPTELALIDYYFTLKGQEAENKVDAALEAQQKLTIANANMGDKVIVSRIVSKVIQIYNSSKTEVDKDRVTGTVISLLSQVKSHLDGRILNTEGPALPLVANIVYDMYRNATYPTVPVKNIKIKLMPGWEGFGHRILLAGFEIIVLWGTVFILSLGGDILAVQSLSVVSEYFETCRRRAANKRRIDDAETEMAIAELARRQAALAAAPPAAVPAAAAAVVAALPPVVAPAAAAVVAPAAPPVQAAAPPPPAQAAANAAAPPAQAAANAAAPPFGGRRRRKTHRKQKKTKKTKKYYRRK